ncbi:MAG: 30S ribosomal protein S4 [Patescibacteria group bacterium]|nr:30S ribosomal protein S4 [Patescibacteria group bacterium]
MARYIGPKDKLSRREGFDLFSVGSKLNRLNVPPGMHGRKGFQISSQYGKQLREKQKVKRIYGVLEKQFRRYVAEALKQKGNTGEALLSFLERRLDNVVYRLGFVPSRPAARQLVSHRHVLVNGKKVNIPSYRVSEGETITLTKKGLEIPVVKQILNSSDFVKIKCPSWVVREGVFGKIVSNPKREDIPEFIREQDIVEFYSR